MSQNSNYNPYGQNTPDPNATPGTSYGPAGSPPPPPPVPGASPNYGPYTPGPTVPGQNPNYGAYNNPYTPNPPTPGPGVNPNYNPYDPYAPTVAAGQGPSPSYNPYVPPAPPAPPVPPPTQGRARGITTRVIVLVALALLLVVGGIAFGLVSYSNAQTSSANATATAAANGTQTTLHLTATAQSYATATAIASTYPFSANLKLSDPLTDNSKGNGWATGSSCKFENSAYHATEANANFFNTCPALKTNFSNFTYQVEMVLNTGDVAGITFRGNDTSSKFYSFLIGTDGSWAFFVYRQASNPQVLKEGTNEPDIVQGNSQTNTLGIVANSNTFSLYVNQKPVLTGLRDVTYSSGQIGVIVYGTNNATTEAMFSNAQVWVL